MRTKFRSLSAGGKIGFVVKYLFLLLCVAIALFPILWVIMSSFKTNAEILSSGISLPSSFSFIGYIQALEISPILRYFGNSVVITLAATFLNVLFLSMAGYIFARCQFKGKNLLYFILSLSLVIPMTALMHPVFMVVRTLGMADTMQGLIWGYMALNMRMCLLLLRSTCSGFPRSL